MSRSRQKEDRLSERKVDSAGEEFARTETCRLGTRTRIDRREKHRLGESSNYRRTTLSVAARVRVRAEASRISRHLGLSLAASRESGMFERSALIVHTLSPAGWRHLRPSCAHRVKRAHCGSVRPVYERTHPAPAYPSPRIRGF